MLFFIRIFFSRLSIGLKHLFDVSLLDWLMGPLKVVLVTDTDSLNQAAPLPYKYYGQKLWQTVRQVVDDLHYRCDAIEISKLDFQEHESVNKYLSADIVIMVDRSIDETNAKSVLWHLGCDKSRSTADFYVSQGQSRKCRLSRWYRSDSSEWNGKWQCHSWLKSRKFFSSLIIVQWKEKLFFN